ncbi:unnamed protein product [Prorocentrum cordatum]|uniref:Uncharacterized protein n=1 Tax=Prorocentrum cordatum TaxID=2364126 RepID=A0ABN9PJ27_9DINO|nr:unnamed protein product [Polarella glacialis]
MNIDEAIRKKAVDKYEEQLAALMKDGGSVGIPDDFIEECKAVTDGHVVIGNDAADDKGNLCWNVDLKESVPRGITSECIQNRPLHELRSLNFKMYLMAREETGKAKTECDTGDKNIDLDISPMLALSRQPVGDVMSVGDEAAMFLLALRDSERANEARPLAREALTLLARGRVQWDEDTATAARAVAEARTWAEAQHAAGVRTLADAGASAVEALLDEVRLRPLERKRVLAALENPSEDAEDLAARLTRERRIRRGATPPFTSASCSCASRMGASSSRISAAPACRRTLSTSGCGLCKHASWRPDRREASTSGRVAGRSALPLRLDPTGALTAPPPGPMRAEGGGGASMGGARGASLAGEGPGRPGRPPEVVCPVASRFLARGGLAASALVRGEGAAEAALERPLLLPLLPSYRSRLDLRAPPPRSRGPRELAARPAEIQLSASGFYSTSGLLASCGRVPSPFRREFLAEHGRASPGSSPRFREAAPRPRHPGVACLSAMAQPRQYAAMFSLRPRGGAFWVVSGHAVKNSMHFGARAMHHSSLSTAPCVSKLHVCQRGPQSHCG